MTWKAEADEIAQRRRWALEHGGADAVRAYREQGWLTIRERIDALVDEGSFQEIGQLAGTASYEGGKVAKVVPAPYVMGLAKIAGRATAVGGEDFSVRGGVNWGARSKGGQGGFSGDLAYEYCIPLVNLCHGAGGSVGSTRQRGHAVFPGARLSPHYVDLLGRVPVVSGVMGTTAGGPAGRAILSHFSVMVRGKSQVFASGPPMVERALGIKIGKEELGGADVTASIAGTIDNVADSEADCLAMVKRFLSFMPQNVWELPPVTACDDPPDRMEEALLSILPRNRRAPYDMRKLIGLVTDRGSLFEIQPLFGRALITSLARMNGRPVGIVANNPMVNGGALDAKAARKQTHFIDVCDTFHIPLIFFVDLPGFMIGPQAEEGATLREGMRSLHARMQASVPMMSVVIRKCYGFAGFAARDSLGLDFKIAWPSAEIGSLPVEGGVTVAYRREIANADDPGRRQAELEDEIRTLASPFRMAEAFALEDVIDPRETRRYLCRFVDAMEARLRMNLGVKARPGVRP
ncbi:MAG: propionyl-CoA carboxylase [Betaproteobacteria bacterium]|nr:propionyl-CoA carboxylase [Betaproteobacteria bacterium]